jgi:transcriptional regulator with GAF, ATPase, and Fis domain
MSTLMAERVAEMFVEFADTLVEEFDLIEFLQMVTAGASELVGSAAAGLLLADPQGRLQFMAASDERTELLELFQVQSHEGPCQDCFRGGVPVVNADLREAADRWPQFAPRAVAAGFRSVHAFPMRLRQDVIGALNLFGTDVGRMEPDDVRTIQALADVATIGLLQERAVRRGEVLTEQLQGALNSRVVIEQAKGAIAQTRSCSVDEAFSIMRGYCRNHNLRLSAVAQAVVADSSPIPGLTAP